MSRHAHADEGFTLIEILIATMITAVILTVLVASFLVFFKNSSYSSGRDDHAAGAEVLSSFLDRDFASATKMTPGPTALTTCGNGTVQQIMTLTWTEYGKPSPSPSATVAPDADPVANGTSYSASYTLEHDDTALATSTTCMIKRTYAGLSTVLMRGLSNVGTSLPSSSSGCTNSVLLTLKTYQASTPSASPQADTSAPYAYLGCIKARTNAL